MIVMLILRFGLIFIISILLIVNIVYPLFKEDVPLFWMFRGRKTREKYKEEYQKLRQLEEEKRIITDLQKRQNKLRGK